MNEVIKTNFRFGMIMFIYGVMINVIYRMGMGNNYAVGIDVCMPVLKRTLRDKNIYRHK